MTLCHRLKNMFTCFHTIVVLQSKQFSLIAYAYKITTACYKRGDILYSNISITYFKR